MTLSEVEGFFAQYSGHFDFEEKTKVLKDINLVIKTSSISTLDSKRDNHLKRADFFNTARFPEMTFISKSSKLVSENVFEVSGDLTVKGKTLPSIIKVKYLGSQIDHVQKRSLFFKGETQIDRQDYGISWNKSLDKGQYLLGDKVKIDFTIQAQPLGKKTAFSTHLIPATKPLDDIARAKRGELPNLKLNPEVPAAVIIPHEKQPTMPVMAKQDKFDSSQNLWLQGILGFIGFCGVVVFSYWIKIKMISFFKKDNYEEISWFSYLGDSVVIVVTFIYAVWFWNVMFH